MSRSAWAAVGSGGEMFWSGSARDLKLLSRLCTSFIMKEEVNTDVLTQWGQTNGNVFAREMDMLTQVQWVQHRSSFHTESCHPHQCQYYRHIGQCRHQALNLIQYHQRVLVEEVKRSQWRGKMNETIDSDGCGGDHWSSNRSLGSVVACKKCDKKCKA